MASRPRSAGRLRRQRGGVVCDRLRDVDRRGLAQTACPFLRRRPRSRWSPARPVHHPRRLRVQCHRARVHPGHGRGAVAIEEPLPRESAAAHVCGSLNEAADFLFRWATSSVLRRPAVGTLSSSDELPYIVRHNVGRRVPSNAGSRPVIGLDHPASQVGTSGIRFIADKVRHSEATSAGDRRGNMAA